MNTRILCLAAWLAAASAGLAQAPSAPPQPDDIIPWQQLIRQGPKTGADLDTAGDQLADAGRFADAAARYASWRDLPDATPDQKALATIKLAQLAESEFELDRAGDIYLTALPLVPPKSPIAHEIRLRIEDLHRRQGNLPKLVHVWETYLTTHGDDAEVGLLLANALAELRRPEELGAWPPSTAKPSDPASPSRLDAARAIRRTGRVNDEREAFAAAFAAETNPLQRLEIIGEMADAYARSGQLDQLVADLREKSRTETDGWRYTVYLAEIQRSARDTRSAMAELARTFGPRSRDPLFLTEAWRISVDLNNDSERARLARLLALVDPGTAREIELVTALLRNGDNAEALLGLHANEDTLSANPLPWHDALLLAAAAGLGAKTQVLLESCLARQPDDWRFRFFRAEASMLQRDFATAEKHLREIEAARPPAASPPASVEAGNKPDSPSGPHYINGITYDSETGHELARIFSRRNVHSGEARELLRQIAAGFDGVSALASRQFLFSTAEKFQPERPLPKNAADAADAALVMRSVLAQQQGRGAEFVTELQGTLATLPPAERIARLALVQALDPLLRELAAEAKAPSGDPLADATGLEALFCLSYSPGLGAMPSLDIDPEVLIPLLQSFLSRETHADTLVSGKIVLSKLLKEAGREKESADLARQALDQWAVFPPERRFGAVFFAIENSDIDHLEALINAIADDARKTNPATADAQVDNDRIRLAAVMAQKRADDPRLVKTLAAALRGTYSIGSPNLSYLALRPARSALRESLKFPYGSRLTDLNSMTWATIFDIANQSGQLAALRDAIARQVQELPPEWNWHARLAGISFAWWAQDRDTAIRDVLAFAETRKDDDLALLAGSMLAEAGRADEARKWFERVSATDGETAIDKLARLLALARAQKDTERAKALALQLTELPLNNSDQYALQGILTDLGLTERAQNFRAAAQAKDQAVFFPQALTAVKRLQSEARDAKHRSEAVDLARNILASHSPLGESQTERYQRSAALDALRVTNAMAGYTDELKRQLAADPNSTETLLRLAEALERTDTAQSLAFYHRAAELRPEDLPLQLHLARTLAGNRKATEAVQVWEAVFAKDPQAIFSESIPLVFETYKSAKQLDLLSADLVKVPVHSAPLEDLNSSSRDTSFLYQEVATAMRDDGKPTEAIRVWQASLARARAKKGSAAYIESSIVQVLVPALLQSDRKEDAAQEIENYFFPPPAPRPALGYTSKSTQRNWSQTSFESDGSQHLQGAAVLRLANSAGALDRLRAKAAAAAAAHPRGPERLLVLWIDILRHDPAQLESLRKEIDAIIDGMISPTDKTRPASVQAVRATGVMSVPTPGIATTAPILQALAEALAEWPAGRPLALHVYETKPENNLSPAGWAKLRRAEIALEIPETETALQALREWLSWRAGAASAFVSHNVAQELFAADLMSRVGMTAEAAALFRKLQDSGELQNRSDLKKRVEELNKRLTPPADKK